MKDKPKMRLVKGGAAEQSTGGKGGGGEENYVIDPKAVADEIEDIIKLVGLVCEGLVIQNLTVKQIAMAQSLELVQRLKYVEAVFREEVAKGS